ncbi:MAG: peroxide stress protein YaaA [Nannocystaceae bacterium]
MIAVLSPAKNLDLSPAEIASTTTQPALMQDARALMRTARGLSQTQIRELMGLSQSLAKLNYERYRAFDLPFTDNNALPAALIFNGDVYRGLRARDFTQSDLEYAQDHLAILSGLYGLLRPLDLVQAYRLEMSVSLKTRRGGDLYAFWGDRVAKALYAALDGHEDDTLVNLASNEYFKVIRAREFTRPIISCVFEDWKVKAEEGRVISFLAKVARGAMARYLVTERVDRVAGLKDFTQDRYRYAPKASSETRLVFRRKFVPVSQAHA